MSSQVAQPTPPPRSPVMQPRSPIIEARTPSPEPYDNYYGDFNLEPSEPPPPRKREKSGYTITDQYGSIQEEDGRTYHGYMPGEYALPNDGEEQNRQDFNHALYELLLDGALAAAPFKDPQYVLDIGTGTGIWANEFAEQNPSSQVIGTDLSLIQPPPRTNNVRFVLENSETQDWVFDQPFDFIHLRSMGPCFNDMLTVLRKSWDNLQPGGWIELQDGLWDFQCLDNTFEGTALQTWSHYIIMGGATVGRDMTKAKYFKDYLVEAGFVDVRERIFPMPGSPWTKDPKMKQLGMFLGTAIWEALDSYRKFLGFAGLSPPQIEKLTHDVRQDLRNLDIHWFLLGYFVYGRKPYDNETMGPNEMKVGDLQIEDAKEANKDEEMKDDESKPAILPPIEDEDVKHDERNQSMTLPIKAEPHREDIKDEEMKDEAAK